MVFYAPNINLACQTIAEMQPREVVCREVGKGYWMFAKKYGQDTINFYKLDKQSPVFGTGARFG
jgi:hypothetical protein